MTNPNKRIKKYYRLAELQADGTFPWSRTEVTRKVERGEIPAPIPLGAKTLAWRASDIEQWEAAKVIDRDLRLAARAEAKAAGEPAPKRPFGRFRKDPTPIAANPLTSDPPVPLKRGRGRPRKTPLPAASPPIAAAPRR